ncbi:MAG: ATP-binding cassette domain-containing protein [Elusimicrobia bacterium]|nr:ATP-binding cassette domain-containing protein [Elusimicrobiota bacterium]MBD3412334.1 ATP-binding cassette domain-containing protein [Elusimicrobiota bacterium]
MNTRLLDIKNLAVEINHTKILGDINLSVDDGEVVVLFGPNGSGKTTLLRTIMGYTGYRITAGAILFAGHTLNTMPLDERVRLGIGIMYQHPPAVRGVKLGQIAEFLNTDKKTVAERAQRLALTPHLSRDVNAGFSGGEMKRSELFQVLNQECPLMLLDEPESGVDIENISLMGSVLGDYLKQKNRSALIITHTGYILDYVEASRACVLLEGVIWCDRRPPKEVFKAIQKQGYSQCIECEKRTIG